MYYLEDLKEMLCKELEKIAEKGELSAGMLETVHKLTDTIKNIDKIEMLEEEGGYSEGSDWMGEGRMYGTSYGNEGGNSYARGRGRNAKRDSRGRYSREGGYSGEGGGGGSYGGSSYGGGSSYRGGRGGYSRADGKEHMVGKLEEMMGMAESEEERKAIRQCIQKLENA